MSTSILLSPKAPDEEKLYSFTFDLASGETISDKTVTCSVYRGFDPDPSGMVAATPTVSGSVVTILIVGGILNNVYNIKCSVTTSAAEIIDIIGSLTIND